MYWKPGCLAAHVRSATSLGNQRYCYRGGSSREQNGAGLLKALPEAGQWPVDQESPLAPRSFLPACTLPAASVPSICHTHWALKSLCTIKTCWWGSWTLREKEKTPLCPAFPGLREQRGVSRDTYPWPGSGLRSPCPTQLWAKIPPPGSSMCPPVPVSLALMSKCMLTCSDLCRIQHPFN